MVLKYHENFTAGVKRMVGGDVHLGFTEDTGHEVNIFPMGREAALQYAEKIKQAALGLETPDE